MTTARELREILDAEHRARRQRRAWEADLGGRTALVSPLQRGRTGGGVQQAPISIPAPTAGSGVGETITVEATTTIPVDGGLIEWDAIVARFGFASATVPTTALTPTIDGAYYDLASVELEWADWRHWDTVEVRVDGISLGEWTDGRGRRTVPFTVPLSVVEADQAIEVFVDHGDSSAHVLTARATLQMIDTAVGAVGDEPVDLGSFGYSETRTVTATIPGSVVAGDLLIAHLHTTNPTTTTPTGWTRAAFVSPATGNSDQRGIIDYRVATAGDAGSEVSWTGSGGTSSIDSCVSITRETGINTSDPFAGTIGEACEDKVSSLTASTTATASSRLLLLAGVFGGGPTSPAEFGWPSGWTAGYEESLGDNRFRLGRRSKDPVSGATGDVTMTLSTGTGQFPHMFLVPLRLSP